MSGFSVPQLIAKKRDGGEHSRAELAALLHAPDYQLSAWLMAVYWQGLSSRETADLTAEMSASGEQYDLSSLSFTTDKHSTGGVGDKTSLILTPMLAALGMTVAKMSGRGLAHTGGTIDKLESFTGWTAELSEEDFLRQARDIGLALVGQSKDLAPADGRLYALRDVTATVDSLPLIASSIMSKKLASGAQTIILDVKVGGGAFMTTPEQGRALAEAMVDIGKHAGRNVRAILTDMNTPLGRAAGNSLEVREAIETLRGKGSTDLTELCVALAAEALKANDLVDNAEEARTRASEVLHNGLALKKFREFVAAQGGDLLQVDHPERLPTAEKTSVLTAHKAGYLNQIDALSVGKAVLALGGGREQKGEAIDHSVGIELLRKPSGDWLEVGEPLLKIYHNERGIEEAAELLTKSIVLVDEPPQQSPIILDVVS